MTLDTLKEEIKKDSLIDSTELAKEALRTPAIHGKYLSIHADLKIELQKLKNALAIMELRKWKLYTGKASKEELEEWGEEPFELNIIKTMVDKFVESDPTLLKIKTDLNLAETKVKMVEDFLKVLSNRNFAIKSAIDWNKLVNGIS
jgi:Recombination, repair and ssDNA binding protein UvsY